MINTSIITNTFIYTLSKIPLIKKLIKENFYSELKIKRIINIIANVLGFISKFIKKLLYLCIIIIIPLLVFEDQIDYDKRFNYAVSIFFFLSIILGSIVNSTILNYDNNKYVNIKLMRFEPKKYTIIQLLYTNTLYFIMFLPAMIILSIIFKGSVIMSVILVFELIMARIIIEAILLFVYSKTGLNLLKSNKLILLFAIISFGLAYIPLFLNYYLQIDRILSNPLTIVAFILLTILSIRYLLTYNNYKKTLNDVIIDKAIDVDYKEIGFQDVMLKDEDLDNKAKTDYNNRKGYDYFNYLFFKRHKRLILNPVLNVTYIVGIILVAGLIALNFIEFDVNAIISNLPKAFPAIIFIMYSISTGAKSARAMFYNCDKSMLQFNFYRQKKTIIYNFIIRLKTITLYNLIPAIAISLTMYILYSVATNNWSDIKILPYMISVCLLAIFFCVHHLFLYYIFQPYTKSLEVKNPLFSIINFVSYILCFSTIYIKTAPENFVIYIIIAIIAYITIALLLLYKLAPRTFRLK